MTHLSKLIKTKNPKLIAEFIKDNNLVIRDGKIRPADDNTRQNCETKYEFYDRSQITKKILLNS